jgi:chitinase
MTTFSRLTSRPSFSQPGISRLGQYLCVAFMALAIAACGDINTTSKTPDNTAAKTTDKPADKTVSAPESAPTKVIAYYMGDGTDLARYDFKQLTHIIYSFLHLNGNQLAFDNEQDQQAFARLVALKKDYPHLKVMLSLGGWGGCETCSDVFNNAENRTAFAQSTRAILQKYQGDGIDLDWEYPTVSGYPGHKFADYDRDNFSALIQALRSEFGSSYELSFAAGGFDLFLETAVDWDVIMPLLDNVNIMSYDLINGFSTQTGHHTALYSTPEQKDSTDNAVQFLLNKGVAPQKIVIGAAFYARVWKDVEATNNGLYQAGTHIPGHDFKDFAQQFSAGEGYEYHWDDIAKAPTYYSAKHKIFATFDDVRSIAAKVDYVKKHKLGGIMFWQLPHDTDTDGLLDSIHKNLTNPVN